MAYKSTRARYTTYWVPLERTTLPRERISSTRTPAATMAMDLPKHVRNGEKSVHFHCNREWEEHHNAKVGHSTEKFSFGFGFLFTTYVFCRSHTATIAYYLIQQAYR
jgi:hypothetical protein